MMHFPLPFLPSPLRLWLLQMSAMGTDKRTDGWVLGRRQHLVLLLLAFN